MSKWVIVAAGPSALSVDWSHLRRFRSWNVMAVNCSWQLVPWASCMYAGDGQWWDRYGEKAVTFQGEKWTRDAMSARRYRLRLVAGRDGAGLCREPAAVNCGGNSGYQAINLAWHFGATRIVLLGFDAHRRNGGHWHGEHEGMLSAPGAHIAVWRRAFGPLATDLKAAGVSVVNATEGTALECFPCRSMAEALR